MKEKIRDKLRELDFFRVPFTIKINKKEAVSSSTSICLSLMFIILTLTMTIRAGFNFFFARSYNINMSFHPRDDLDIHTLPKSSVKFILTVMKLSQDKSDYILKEAIKSQRNETRNIKIVNGIFQASAKKIGYFENCSEINFDRENDVSLDLFSKQEEIKNSLCFIAEEDISFGGSFFKNKETFLSSSLIQFDFCKIFEESCNDPAKLAEVYQKSPIIYSLTYLTHIPDYKSNKGYKEAFNNVSNRMLIATQDSFLMSYSKTSIQTDRNWIFDIFEKDYDEYFFVNQLERTSLAFQDTKDFSLSILFDPSHNNVQVDRIYVRLDEELATVGVVIQISFIALQMFNNFYNNSIADIYFCKKLYFIEQYLPKKLDLVSNNGGVNNRSVGITSIDNNSKEKTFERIMVIQKTKLSTMKTFSATSMESLRFVCCSCKKRAKSQFLKSALGYLEFDSDYLTLVKKGIQFENLLKVLLSESQRDLFKLTNSRKIAADFNHERNLCLAVKELPNFEKLTEMIQKVEEVKSAIDEDDYLTSRIVEVIEQHN